MITATYTYYAHGQEHTVRVDRVINRGQWWGKTWLIEVGIGNAGGLTFVAEAGNESDALDEFADSKWAHLISVPEDEVAEDTHRAGNYGIPVCLDHVSIRRCTVNYFVKQEVS